MDKKALIVKGRTLLFAYKQQVIAALGLIITLLFFVSITSDKNNTPGETPISMYREKLFNHEIDNQKFWGTFKEEKKEEKKLLKAEPVPEDYFEVQEMANQFASVSPSETLRHRLIRKRDTSGGVFYVDNDQGTVSQGGTLFENKRHHADYGEPTITASYPATMDRVLTANKVINATLYTTIKSELGSENVLAMVSDDVYGFHGRKVLVPQGTWAFGCYQPLQKIGDTRIAIKWYRMLTPEGLDIMLRDKEQGQSSFCNGYAGASDIEGAAGVTGNLDNKILERYGSAFLIASISAGSQLTVPADNENAEAAADSLSESLGPVLEEDLEQKFNIAPTVEIPKSTRIKIRSTVDIWFRDPVNNKVYTQKLEQ
jgi:type IV secretory pathway VirB10-like protein